MTIQGHLFAKCKTLALKLDYRIDRLIVWCPTFGHEVLSLLWLWCSTNYEDDNGLSTIIEIGVIDILFSGGEMKSLD